MRGLRGYAAALLMAVFWGGPIDQAKKAGTAVLMLTLGDLSRPIYAGVLVLWCLDFILGFTLAALSHQVSSRRLFYGLIKLLIYLAVLSVSWQIHQVVPTLGLLASGMLDSYVALTEASSVLRNAADLGDRCGFSLPGINHVSRFLVREAQHPLDKLDPDDTPPPSPPPAPATHPSVPLDVGGDTSARS
ncbi:MAG: phage holin family protein [Candidatus Xenobia bacterium]